MVMGRPPGPPKTRLGFYLPNWIVRRIRAVENQSEFIENCIVEATGWKKPGPNESAPVEKKKPKARQPRVNRQAAPAPKEISSLDDLDRLTV